MSRRGWIGSLVLLVVVVGIAGGLATWKYMAMQAADAASANPPEPAEAVTAAVAARRRPRWWRPTRASAWPRRPSSRRSA